MTDANTEATAGTTPAAPQPVNLQVTDIINVAILLKVAIERGAFKAEEIGEVGGVYTRLNAFVQFVQANAKAESDAANAASTETSGTTPAATTAEVPATPKKKGGKGKK